MKRALLVSWLALALTLALPPLLRPAPPPAETAAPAAPEAPTAAGRAPEGGLRLHTAEGTRELDMTEYLVGALAAEMPASFEPEALKAQTVALRSYARYWQDREKPRHPEADLCDDPGCCAAWLDAETLRARWGGSYSQYADKLRRAVEETEGEYLSWSGEAILAVFHASSATRTEDGAALGLSAPYLISVETPETAESVRGLYSTVEVTPEEFADTLRAAAPGESFDFSGPPSGWLGATELDAAGRVSAAELGGRSLSGLALRQCFGLRSTDFTLAYDGTRFVFRVRGYGHGVGMSQYGAQELAKAGADYREILAHYYPQTELVRE